MNYIKTFTLMAFLTGIFMLVGNYFGGMHGMTMAFGIAIAMNFLSYWFSDKIVLAMYGAKEIKREDSPQLFTMVSNLSTRAQLPMPRVYIINDSMANAFATGRDPQHAAVAVTAGILEILTQKQLEAVLAHELTHVKNRDILIGTIAATMAAAITMVARFVMFFGGGGRDDDRGGAIGMILLLILAPFAAFMIQMAISRSREYAADTGSAEITGRPQELIGALEALHASVKKRPAGPETQPATAHMFIVNPFNAGFIASLFSTHPTLEQRRANLEKFGKQ